jgi:hypothetical protein
LSKRGWAALVLWTGAACGGEPPALTLGEVAYTENELLGLSEARRAELATITAFALATARGETLVALAPLLERSMDEALLTHVAAELVLREGEVDDANLRAHYLNDPAVELTVRHVLFFSERWRPRAHRDEAERKAETALERLRGGDPFPDVAAELSEEPGAAGRQGLLTPGREGSWVSEFWNAALALEVDEISPVVETQYGYHVLHLEDRSTVPFEETRATIALEVAMLMGGLNEARLRASLDQAQEFSVSVPEAERASITRELEDRALRWSTALGFAESLTSPQVKDASLAALGSTAQGATIARNELAELQLLLEAWLDRNETLGRLRP